MATSRSMSLRAGPALTAVDRRCLALFEEELDYVFESSRRLGAGPKETEVLVAQAFAAFYRASADLAPAPSLRPFLFDVLVKLVGASWERSWWMRLGVRRAGVPSTGRSLAGASTPRELLWGALGTLSFMSRVVLVMHDLDGVPVPEIARRSRTPKAMVRVRLWRARRVLSSQLSRLRAGVEPGKAFFDGASGVEALPDLMRARAVAAARATVPHLRPVPGGQSVPRSRRSVWWRWTKLGLVVFTLAALARGLASQERRGFEAPPAPAFAAETSAAPKPRRSWQPRRGGRPIGNAGHVRRTSPKASPPAP